MADTRLDACSLVVFPPLNRDTNTPAHARIVAMDSKTEYAEPKAVYEHDNDPLEHKEVEGQVTEVNAASVALAAAVAEQKPSHFSPNMLRLYGIMAIGYLVSTMNGFGR